MGHKCDNPACVTFLSVLFYQSLVIHYDWKVNAFPGERVQKKGSRISRGGREREREREGEGQRGTEREGQREIGKERESGTER